MLSRFLKNERGAAMVEFAFVAPVAITLVMAGLDLGYQQYLRAVIGGSVEAVARKASVGSGMTSAQIDTSIKTKIAAVIPSNAPDDAITITKKSYYNFSRVGKPERLTTDQGTIGTYDQATDCYEDANENNRYDAAGGASGIGGADDIVFYQVDVQFPRLLPVAGLLGLPTQQTASVKSIIRNQPFDGQNAPKILCRTP
jgi:Flp pilus assembly pilin Flp